MASDLVLFEGEIFNLGYSAVHRINLLHNPKELASAKGVAVIECNEENIQQALENKKADIILLAEKSPRDKLRQRRTALDEAMCRLARQQGVAIAFSFSFLLNASDRAQAIGRMRLNLQLCRKHKLPVIFASFAKDKFEMRGLSDLKSLLLTVGFTPSEANGAFEIYDEIARAKQQKAANGVRIVG